MSFTFLARAQLILAQLCCSRPCCFPQCDFQEQFDGIYRLWNARARRSATYRVALPRSSIEPRDGKAQKGAREGEREMLLLLLLLFDSRCSRARFAHASLSVSSGIAGLLPAKWTIRNDTGGCHFSAKCRVLSAGDDGSRLYIFFLSLLLLLPSLLYISLPRLFILFLYLSCL